MPEQRLSQELNEVRLAKIVVGTLLFPLWFPVLLINSVARWLVKTTDRTSHTLQTTKHHLVRRYLAWRQFPAQAAAARWHTPKSGFAVRSVHL
ncbi:MAG TPA: hypothetical protein PLU80_15285 [Acidobacteriota bacterium]|nr:hypothetical protein [Acidobacteriota bacterium]